MRARSTSRSPLSGRRHRFYYRPKQIFIGGGELEKYMRHSYENGLKGHGKVAQGIAGE
jgi:hypothetical protein